MNKITLREATMDDCNDLYYWRNDPVTRQQSFSGREISYEEHCDWFKRSLAAPDRLFFMGINKKGEKCGVVRFDIKNELFAETHINVAPEKRGKGVGSQLILESCSLFFLRTKRKLILARTKEKNTVSIKVFLKAGFSEVLRYNDTEQGGVVVLALLAPYGGVVDCEDPLYGQQSNRLQCPQIA